MPCISVVRACSIVKHACSAVELLRQSWSVSIGQTVWERMRVKIGSAAARLLEMGACWSPRNTHVSRVCMSSLAGDETVGLCR